MVNTRSVVTASSIRRRSAAWTILLDWTYQSSSPSGLARPAAHETLLFCGRVIVGTAASSAPRLLLAWFDQALLLGRGLINTQPNADGRKFDKGKIIGCEPVVASGYTTTLLDLVEEPLDEITRAI